MNGRRENQMNNDKEFLENMARFLLQIDSLNPEEIKEELRVDGIEPEALIQRGLAFVEEQRRLAIKRLMDHAKQRNQSFLEKIVERKNEGKTIEELRTDVKTALSNLSGQGKTRFAMAFRNLDNQSEQDLRSILEDIDRIQILEKQTED